LILAFAQKSQ